MHCFKAIQAPVMEAVRVPPSAWITSQSTLIWRSPRAFRSTTARRERPIRRWISWVRPDCLPDAASRRPRVWVARGSMPYSAVTQPAPLLRIQPGTLSSRLAVTKHLGVAEADQAGALGVTVHARFDGHGPQLIGLAFGGAHKRGFRQGALAPGASCARMGAAYPMAMSQFNASFGDRFVLERMASLGALDERARAIFRNIVETYLETGEPVGSRTAFAGRRAALSPASIRNTMQDLTHLGLLSAPHTSAGRLPTHAGLRLFVDGLMEIGDIGEDEKRGIEARLVGRGQSFQDALDEASSLLSGLAGGAGMVVTPVRDAGVKHVEFVALGGDQTLAVMVFDDGAVENRLMRTPPGLTPSSLQEASNFLNARLKGRTLSETKAEVGVELDVARSELNATAARLVEDGLAAWGGGGAIDRALIVRGRANLLHDAQAADLERVRSLFDDLWNRKNG